MRTTQVIQALKNELFSLKRMIAHITKELRHVPPGSVQIRKHKKGIQFYHHLSSDQNAEKYMPVKKKDIGEALVRKRYFLRLMDEATKQQRIIDSFIKKYDPQALQKVFLKESAVRQALLLNYASEKNVQDLTNSNIILPDALYAELWEKYEYEKKPFLEDVPAHYTRKQERVRSKSEVLIANTLFRFGIPYRYECPLTLGQNVIHPDFTILRIADRKTLHWEHLGLMDETGYARAAVQRLDVYEQNGMSPGDHLIITSETSRMPLNSIKVERMIRHYIFLE